MFIYKFDETDVYRPYVEAIDCKEYPVSNNYLKEEPLFESGYWPCEKDGQWIQIEDHRNQTGWTNGLKLTITNVGPLPEDWSLEYVKPDLDTLKQYYLSELAAYRLQVEYEGTIIPIGNELVKISSTVKDETRLNTITNILKTTGQPYYEGFKVGDDKYITLTLDLINFIMIFGGMHISKVFTVEKYKREQINNFNDDKELHEWARTELKEGWYLTEEERIAIVQMLQPSTP